MFAFILLSSATASDNHSSPEPKVSHYLSEWNLPCLQQHCAKEVNECATGTDVCRKRLMCITHDLRKSAKLEQGAGCFADVDFTKLDHLEVQIVDCAQHMKCAPMNELGISFLQETMTEREIPTMAQKQSLMQIQALIQNELSGHMHKAAHAVNLMKSHLTYMDAAGDAVKKTTSLIQEVAKDKSLSAEKKLQALDRLSTHLNDIQQSVFDQHAQLGSLLPAAADTTSFLEELQALGEVPQENGGAKVELLKKEKEKDDVARNGPKISKQEKDECHDDERDDDGNCPEHDECDDDERDDDGNCPDGKKKTKEAKHVPQENGGAKVELLKKEKEKDGVAGEGSRPGGDGQTDEHQEECVDKDGNQVDRDRDGNCPCEDDDDDCNDKKKTKEAKHVAVPEQHSEPPAAAANLREH